MNEFEKCGHCKRKVELLANCGHCGWQYFHIDEKIKQEVIEKERKRIIDIIFKSPTLLDLEKVELTEKIEGKIL